MADVAAGRVGKHAQTLVANTVLSVTFNDDLDSVEIAHDGTADLYLTVDGSTPVIGGDGSWCIPAGFGADTFYPPSANGTVVKVISAGTPKVWIQRGH
ncbi:hypothetical protein [Nocardioides kribbensis]|uniref:Uncharacterized protein n=1 Tax=Nocardioides kribbensis TaxID=305517 RepID=A0ABV1NYZ8_9ACTN